MIYDIHISDCFIIAVAGELTTALESSVRGDALDLASTLRNCTKIYPELFPSTRDPENRVKCANFILFIFLYYLKKNNYIYKFALLI
jgi:hypothetical protein